MLIERKSMILGTFRVSEIPPSPSPFPAPPPTPHTHTSTVNENTGGLWVKWKHSPCINFLKDGFVLWFWYSPALPANMPQSPLSVNCIVLCYNCTILLIWSGARFKPLLDDMDCQSFRVRIYHQNSMCWYSEISELYFKIVQFAGLMAVIHSPPLLHDMYMLCICRSCICYHKTQSVVTVNANNPHPFIFVFWAIQHVHRAVPVACREQVSRAHLWPQSSCRGECTWDHTQHCITNSIMMMMVVVVVVVVIWWYLIWWWWWWWWQRWWYGRAWWSWAKQTLYHSDRSMFGSAAFEADPDNPELPCPRNVPHQAAPGLHMARRPGEGWGGGMRARHVTHSRQPSSTWYAPTRVHMLQ